MFRGKKFAPVMAAAIMILSLLAACAPAATPVQPTATTAGAAPTTAAPTTAATTAATSAASPTGAVTAAATGTSAAGAGQATATGAATAAGATATTSSSTGSTGGKKFTIGISNPFISSEYRTQMIQELKDVNAEYMKAGITNDLVIESADTDVAGQIQQLQNLMNKNVDAILVNPSDVNALNATLQEAIQKGILVISVDQELPNTQGVYDVGLDQKLWAETSAKWLAQKLNGKGNIVEIEGIPGNPANALRMSGVDEVLKNYPNIKVLGKQPANWDEGTGQQVMSNLLASFPNMDGYWTQDGMAIGVFQAVLSANPTKLPVGDGEARCQFLNLWNETLKTHPDFETIAVANPPGVAATGLRIAVNMLQGKKPDTTKLGGQSGRQFVIPIPIIVTKDNFQQALASCNGKPATYLLDGIMTDQEVQQFFTK